MLSTWAGQTLDALDTPALLLDLDAFERNLALLSREIAAAGVAWRPHAKGHKCPAIAHKQLTAGAIGITCAKLGEAEVMAQAGIRDILIANQIVGPIKARRLAALAAHADPVVAVDSLDNARELAAAARARGTRPRVIIEVNVGMNRAGVLPGEPAVRLASEVAALDGLRFAGLMGYEGHGMEIPDPVARAAAITAAIRQLAATAEACRAAGLPVEIVSASGTGTYRTAVTVGGITEVQAGGGIFGDAVYRDLDVPVEPALVVLTQVTSRPAPDRVIVDAGRKTIDPGERPPRPRRLPGVRALALSAEHGTILLEQPAECPRVGDRLELEVGYHDQAVHLHEVIVGVRNGIIEVVWPVAARGRLQ